MQMEIKREAEACWMVLRGKVAYHGDYQMKMLERTRPKGLLPLRLRGRDDETEFFYCISGLTSLQNYYQRHPLDEKEIMKLSEKIADVTDRMRPFLLEADRLVLNPSCIYRNENEFLFCYLPVFRKSFADSFHQLTEYFVRELDYGNPMAIQTACRLHKYTMQENYRLKDVIQKVQSEIDELSLPEKEESIEDTNDTDLFIEENIQKPSRKQNRKKKMSKWGDWENL